MRKLYLVVATLFVLVGPAQANNIEVTNVTLTDQNAGAGTTQIQFDLSWENSWRISVGPANYDAAWVFAKYRVNGQAWNHATLATTGFVAAPGSTVEVADNVGAFIYRSADGSGNLSLDNLELRWDYQADGVSSNAVVDIQVFAIEMVYVPQGAFYLGQAPTSGSSHPNAFFTRSQVGFLSFYNPYEVTSEAAITIGNTAGANQLYYSTLEGTPGDQSGPIPAAFPKGFLDFYCMKYETSQEQWVAFFNTLSSTQRAALDLTGLAGKNSDAEIARNGVSWPDGGNATTTLPNVPVSYVNNNLVMAYLDWAGLRPMTEMEFEKACRGPLNPVSEEYAWGTSNIHATSYTLLNSGLENELIADAGSGTGNTAYLSTTTGGPLRCGIFAASAGLNNREETGGSYYGIMELSGNLYERIISVGNPEGRAFTGNHGDGVITPAGAANVAGWPASDAGIGYRGGSYPNQFEFLQVANRNDAANTFPGSNTRIGFRGVRTAIQ